MNSYRTQEPLIVFGATGMLASELVFMNFVARFTPTVVLHSTSETRLEGLKDELQESGFGNDEIRIYTTTEAQEACDFGGRLFFAKSVRAERQTREEMLLVNAPMALEVARAISKAQKEITRVICVSNPSDLMGLMLLVHSGLHPDQVASLSALDTLRLRRSLTKRFGAKESEMEEAFTLGSHDESMAPMLHRLRVRGKSLEEHGYGQEDFQSLYKQVRKGGISIYKLRGHTAYQSPAVLGLQMLMASDEEPFSLPFGRYIHSDRYPHSFGSLSGVIDSRGARHLETSVCAKDLHALNLAFGSIAYQRDLLIKEGFLPDPGTWRDELQRNEDLVKVQE